MKFGKLKGIKMKVFNALLVVFIFSNFVTPSFCDENEKGDISIKSLIEKGISVKKYSGYRFVGVMLNGMPSITEEYVQVNSEIKQNDVQDMLEVFPQYSQQDKLKTDQILDDQSKVQVAKVLWKKEDEGDDAGSIKLNSYDASGNVVYVEWRYLRNGFPYKSATYDQRGNLINFDIYFNLDFDNDRHDDVNQISTKRVQLKTLVKKYGDLDLADIDGVNRLCELILKEQMER